MESTSTDTASPPDETLPEGVLLRLNDWSETGAWALAVLVAIAGALVLLPLRHGQGDSPSRLILGLTWLAVAAMIAEGAWSGLIVDSRGITVRRLRRRRCWSWSEVDRFELKRAFFRPSLRIHFADGAEASALGFSGRSARERDLAQRRVAELNRRAAAAADQES